MTNKNIRKTKDKQEKIAQAKKLNQVLTAELSELEQRLQQKSDDDSLKKIRKEISDN